MNFNHKISELPFSFFEGVNKEIKQHNRSDFISLHQGLTYLPPCTDLSNWNSSNSNHDAPPSGDETLLNALANKLSTQLEFSVNPETIAITYGISHGLNCAFKLILSQGDEVLVLSPQWLFVTGHIVSCGGLPIEIPFFTELADEKIRSISDLLDHYITPKTKAIYFNTPNNPTGFSLNVNQLEEILSFAEKHDLWIISDNAYEYFDFSVPGFFDIRKLKNAHKRVFSCYSFSKSYSMSGYRIGYTIPPSNLSSDYRKMILYSVYCIANPSQYAASQALSTSQSVLLERKDIVNKLRMIAIEHLKLPFSKPHGGFYIFLNLNKLPISTDKYISLCIENGVSLTPGIFFGKEYSNYARICYSIVPAETLMKGIEIINNTYYQLF